MQVVAGAGLPDMNSVRQQYQNFMRANNLPLSRQDVDDASSTEGSTMVSAENLLGQLGQGGEGAAEAIQRLLEGRIRDNLITKSPKTESPHDNKKAEESASSPKPKPGIDEKVFAQHFNVPLNKIAKRVFILSQLEGAASPPDSTSKTASPIAPTDLSPLAIATSSTTSPVGNEESGVVSFAEEEQKQEDSQHLIESKEHSDRCEEKVNDEVTISEDPTKKEQISPTDAIFDGFWLLSLHVMESIYKEVVPEQLITILSNLAAAFISVSLVHCITFSQYERMYIRWRSTKMLYTCAMMPSISQR